MSDDTFLRNPEKRHYHRLDLELPVEIHVDGTSLNTTTGNVSCGGMFLPNVRRDLQVNETLVTFVHLPNRSEAVRLPARVTRVEPSSETLSSQVAVAFDGLYDDNRLAVETYIKWKLLH